jgi:hypothetical protein
MLTTLGFGAALLAAVGVGAAVGGDKKPVTVTDNRVDNRVDNRKFLIYSQGDLTVDRSLLKGTDSFEPHKITSGHTPTITELEDAPYPSPSYYQQARNLLSSPYSIKKDRLSMPLKITALGAGGCSTIYLLRKSAHWFTQQQDMWCNWKRDIPTAELHTAENIAQTLVMEIQNKYTTTQNAYDFVEPLQIFLEVIDREIYNLSWYRSFTSGLHSLYVGKLFGINEDSLQHVEDSLQRTLILKKIFILWTAELKFGKAAQNSLFECS